MLRAKAELSCGLTTAEQDQVVEMTGQRQHRLGGVEHQVHVADVDRGTDRSEDRLGHGITHEAIIEEQPEGRVEVVEQAATCGPVARPWRWGRKSPHTPSPRAKISSVWRGMQTSMSVSGRRE